MGLDSIEEANPNLSEKERGLVGKLQERHGGLVPQFGRNGQEFFETLKHYGIRMRDSLLIKQRTENEYSFRDSDGRLYAVVRVKSADNLPIPSSSYDGYFKDYAM